MFDEYEYGFKIIPKKILQYYNFETIKKKEIETLKLIKNGDLGFFSNVYQINDNECLKIFKLPKYNKEIKKFSYFSRYNIEGCVLPKRLYSMNRKFYGYSMDLINGVLLNEISDMNYSDYIFKTKEILTETVTQLSECGIKIQDASDKNIMYDKINNCFKIIDCDYWQHTNDTLKELKSHNYKVLNFELSSYLFGCCYILPKMEDDYVEYCEEIRSFLENKFDYKIKTINDSRKFRKW